MKKTLLALICCSVLALSACGRTVGSGMEIQVECKHRFAQVLAEADTVKCANSYEVKEQCRWCGLENGVVLTVPPDEHIWAEEVMTYGNCSNPKLTSHTCSDCGATQPISVNYEGRAKEIHDYQPYSDSYVKPEYNVVISYTCDRCARCGDEINWVQTSGDPVVPEEL